MKILVVVKRVIDFNVQVRVKEDGTGVRTDNVKMATNPPDDNAVEEAVKIKESGKATEVIAVTIGNEKAQESEKQPNLLVDVDKSLCIGCCSCEIIAPEVFSIDKKSKTNPKSSVINQKGAGVNKIMNAAETCPTKAIIVKNSNTKEKLFPH